MFLQGDKPTPTLTRERASQTLFGDNDSATDIAVSDGAFVNFSNDHNVTEFKNLVQTKYPQTFGATSFFDTTGSADSGTFNTYLTSRNVAEPQATPEIQKYYNDSNPIPQQYQSFKPKVMTDFEDLQLPNPKGELDEALLQKIDEIQVFEPKAATTKIAFDVDADVETEAFLRLNAKGIIACVTFIAVTLLIIFLVIYNSITISSSGNQIRRLKQDNSELQQQHSIAESERMAAFLRGEAAAQAFAGSSGAEQPTHVTLPPVSSYPLTPTNPDESTNWCDQISKFFSSLFR